MFACPQLRVRMTARQEAGPFQGTLMKVQDILLLLVTVTKFLMEAASRGRGLFWLTVCGDPNPLLYNRQSARLYSNTICIA